MFLAIAESVVMQLLCKIKTKQFMYIVFITGFFITTLFCVHLLRGSPVKRMPAIISNRKEKGYRTIVLRQSDYKS